MFHFENLNDNTCTAVPFGTGLTFITKVVRRNKFGVTKSDLESMENLTCFRTAGVITIINLINLGKATPINGQKYL